MQKTAAIMISMLFIATAVIVLNDQIELSAGDDAPTRNSDDWTMDMKISDICDSSFIGEASSDGCGIHLSGAGDVNGDGYDDILIASSTNDEGASNAGQVYLIFGNSSLGIDTSLSDADASFIGENADDEAGLVSAAGDVNGDGYDDFLIGVPSNDEGGTDAGQTYLILGKESGWSMDTDLSNADASFRGQSPDDRSGCSIDGAGDVNGDGYDDILIGANQNDLGGSNAGKSYLIFGRESGWSMDTPLMGADASFIGEAADDDSGYSVSGAGDVNRDGYDDILIGARNNDEGGSNTGQTYLIFGRSGGLGIDMILTDADASFHGEGEAYRSGASVSSAGDVNGDGYDDILIGANQFSGLTGKTYLIFGRASGLTMDASLSDANASFIGENINDNSGMWIDGAGDVNGDGYDDLLIGAPSNSGGGTYKGQAYFYFGDQTGWTMNMELSDADASFIGEFNEDHLGQDVSSAGDFDGDGSNDILLGARWNDEGGDKAGQAYLLMGTGGIEPTEVYSFQTYLEPYVNPSRLFDLGETVYLKLTGKDGDPDHRDSARIDILLTGFPSKIGSINLRETGNSTGEYIGVYRLPLTLAYFDALIFEPRADPSKAINIVVDYPFRPTSVSQVSIFSDQAYSTPASMIDFNEKAYIKVYGTDTNAITQDKAFVNLTSDKNASFKEMLILDETGINTGEYVGSFPVPEWMQYFENITVRSVRDSFRYKKFMVHTPVQIRPLQDVITAMEDEEYRVQYSNFGYNPVTWTFQSNAEWLTWDKGKRQIYSLPGTPNNNHIGLWSVWLNAEDSDGNRDSHVFTIEVINTPPEIIGTDITEIHEEEFYYKDYDSSDDGQGEITWTLITSTDWLEIDKESGELSGTPYESDRGTWNVSVVVNDGNGGSNSTDFQLTVLNINKPPSITTDDITTAKQNERYYRNYEVYDQDQDDVHTWELYTDALFLSIDNDTGELEGTPGPYEVGAYYVNVTVRDSGGLTDSHVFELMVQDVNDAPIWEDVPDDEVFITHGEVFYFDFNATDPDPDGVVEYSVRTDPESDMDIDPDTGVIEWTASIRWFQKAPYRMKVTAKASDGILFRNHEFFLIIEPTQSPTVGLISPKDEEKTVSDDIWLMWEGADPEGETLTYDIYLHKTEAYVEGLRSEASYKKNHEYSDLVLSDLEQGATYYWIVIPFDGGTYGRCAGGSRSFRVNFAPIIRSISPQEVKAGEELKVKISCSDQDPEDAGILEFTILTPIEGMTISDTGTFRWKPEDGDVGDHMVTVQVSDGIENVTASLQITVLEGEGGGFLLYIGIGAGAAVLIGIIILLVFLLLRKNKKEEKEEEVDEESEAIRREMEEHLKEREWEDDHMGPKPKEEQPPISDVPLTAAEAHAHDRDKKKKLTYEDLYGSPAPSMDEDVSAGELKEHLQEAVSELQQMEAPTEEDIVPQKDPDVNEDREPDMDPK
ncbi:MAG: putative Ig domain-containing protein [Thermoplasmatota archaeon]